MLRFSISAQTDGLCLRAVVLGPRRELVTSNDRCRGWRPSHPHADQFHASMEKMMKFMSRTLLPVLAFAASVSLAQAQTPQGHQTHHPAGQGTTQAAPSTSSAQPQGGMQGMMGQGGMMPMMQGMMGQQGAGNGSMPCPMMAKDKSSMGGMAMPFEHVEGRIAFLKAELGISDTQNKVWSTFADALRRNAEVHRTMHEGMMQGDQAAASLTERLNQREKTLAARLEAVKSLNAAATPLFATLSEEQRKTADDLLGDSLGMM